ncbi:Hypothetical Protein FCC1311_097932 [Hondaea fermentalgiana]|uniref:Uncharacterized protein n=1 Tax=Hondaea fermentalgiana TaxID=2315210 RepID=A0A2R5GRU5_9STRA|nr:Hypothetical Protein FCC1311_097932 [Hondaea fermentalgiana]|eukprot:GBG33570.1 Hypothetical Protein FCC1311_097932 [Hondaea fermentalgiana]
MMGAAKLAVVMLLAMSMVAQLADARRSYLQRLERSIDMKVSKEPGGRFSAVTKFKLVDGAPACTIDPNTGLPVNAEPQRAYFKTNSRIRRLTKVYLVEIDFNPCGHPPQTKWDIPHFDIHWYHDSETTEFHPQDDSVVCTPPEGYPFDFVCDDPEWFYAPEGVEAGNLAEGLTIDDHGVQNMGTHWYNHDLPASEDWDEPVFIQGTYDGSLVFYELMFPARVIEEEKFHYYAPSYPDKTFSFLPDMLMTWSKDGYAYMKVYGSIP